MNQLRIIKIIVFIFTFLLIFGTLALLGGMYGKISANSGSQNRLIDLNLSSSATVKQITAGGNYLYIYISDNGQEHIAVYNADHNQIKSNIIVKEMKNGK